jgi:hypothetical protein
MAHEVNLAGKGRNAGRIDRAGPVYQLRAPPQLKTAGKIRTTSSGCITLSLTLFRKSMGCEQGSQAISELLTGVLSKFGAIN